MTVTRRRFAQGTLVSSALAASAIVPASSLMRPARAAEPLKVAVLYPRSGLFALNGQAAQRGCDLAVDLMKQRGIAVELINADTESSPDIGRTQAEKVLRDGAHMMIGCFDSPTTQAVAQVAEQKGVPFLISIGADPKLTEQGFKYVFRNFATAPMLSVGGLPLMGDLFTATGFTPKTAVLMHVNDSFGMAMMQGITATVPKLGLPFQVVESISYDPKARDISIEVAKAKAVGADIHIAVARLNDAIMMIREMVKQRYEPKGIFSLGGPGMYENQFAKALGKNADYCITNLPWFDPKQKLNQDLKVAFEKAYPEELYELNIGFSFEAILVAADAYRRAGSTNPQALVEALKTTNIADRVMLGGPIRFDEKGQNPNIASASIQIQHGKPTVILPTASAEAKPVFPIPGWQKRT